MRFPRFNDGDVEIKFTADGQNNYVLHSYVLALHSPWFKASLSERWSQGQPPTPGSKRLYELRFESGTTSGTLMRSTSVGETEMVDDDQALKATREKTIEAHQAVLGTLYHVSPVFPAFWNEDFSIADTRASRDFVKALVDTADYYDCAPVADVHVDRYLRQWTGVVLEECFADPYRMLSFGVEVKSVWVVKEACAYLIGDYEPRWEEARLKVDEELPNISGILERKRARFITTLKDAELRLFRIKSRDATWGQLAADIFRQWLTDRLDAGRGSSLGFNYAETYRQILGGKAPFKLTMRMVHQHCGTLSRDWSESTLQVIGAAWDELFVKAGEIVEDLCEDDTMLKGKMDTSTNLRFMTLKDDELPWKQET